jgi:hypothetical protein
VAFARPGKPPEIPFAAGSELRPPFDDPTNSREASTVPKASWRKVAASGAMGMMAVTKKREVRKSLRQPAWITLEGGFAARQCMVQDYVKVEGTGMCVQISGSVSVGVGRSVGAR